MMFGRVGKERIVGAAWGALFTAILAVLIVVGSRNLQHFDAALVGYTFAVLFATFAITYRYSIWLQRPPTKRYWNRGWQLFFSRKYLVANIRNWFARVTADFALNRFIFKRGAARGLAHALIMWGCILAFAITFPLVFGWIHFETVQGYGYDFLALLHAITVIFTLLYLPFGKFFHIFQRPAQLGVSFYKDVAAKEGMAKCLRCGDEFAPLLQIEDLIEVERELGYRYGEYQRICPACRRSMLAIAQGRLWAGGGQAILPVESGQGERGQAGLPVLH